MVRLRSRVWCTPLLAFVFTFALALGAIGCNSSFKDYCEKALDCQNHNDADVEECEIRNSAEEEVANLKGCTEQYEAAFACRDEKGSCQEVAPGRVEYRSNNVCEAENNRHNECIN